MIHTSNGHAAAPPAAAEPSPRPSAKPSAIGALRVFRVEKGQSAVIRVLSPKYGGLFTHYHRGKSVVCQGANCSPAWHKSERHWKGYAAVEVWNDARKKWQPYVLEITECLELDLRTVWARGQVWEIYREFLDAKKNTPVQGKLLEERDPDAMPPAFDFRPVLMHLYHAEQIDLSHPNPMPPRVIMAESDGDAPEVFSPRVENLDTDPTPIAERMKEYLKSKRSPSDKKPQ